MRGDIPLAAFRLLQTLPVRTHERSEQPAFVGRNGGSGRAMRIEVAGVVYESKKHVQRALGVGYSRLREWERDGKARVVK